MKRLIPCTLAALVGCAPAANSQAGAENTLRRFSDGLADMVERVKPSVVIVQTETTRTPVYIDYFFHRRIPGAPETRAGQGSGVIIDTKGHIVTSQHVIDKADEIKVVLNDGQVFDAEVVGEDPHTDIGVIRIVDPGNTKLVPIEPGDSNALRVGEIVVGIGSPFSLSSSVTMGIVSAKGRQMGMLPYEDFIQTDAAINPGNSGGPLVDADGNMIGLNAIIHTSGFSPGSIGIGFAVPGNRVFAIARTLIAGEAVQRPWLGIYPMEMDPARAQYFLKQNGGVYAGEVYQNTPAHKAGLRPGDIILAVDEEPVLSRLDLQREVFNREIGDPVILKVLRSGHTINITVKTEQMPDARTFK